MCACRNGYKMSSKMGINGVLKRQCVNINECEEQVGVCSQKCKDTEGSFKCFCAEHYKKWRNTDSKKGRKTQCKAKGKFMPL